MTHTLSPTGVFIVLMFALVIDWMSVGPTGWRDRIAWGCAVVAINQGFNDSPLDAWTVGALTGTLDGVTDMATGAYIAGADTSQVLGAAVSVLAIYTLGCLAPTSWSKRIGGLATLAFTAGAGAQRLNYRLWACAFLLGILSDLPQGWLGELVRGGLDVVARLVSWIPGGLFGVTG